MVFRTIVNVKGTQLELIGHLCFHALRPIHLGMAFTSSEPESTALVANVGRQKGGIPFEARPLRRQWLPPCRSPYPALQGIFGAKNLRSPSSSRYWCAHSLIGRADGIAARSARLLPDNWLQKRMSVTALDMRPHE